jgi:hypothetical protein
VQGASTGSSYAWSVDGGEIWSGQGSSSVEVEWRSTLSGTVKVIETDENGCPGDTVYLQTGFGAPAGVQSLLDKVKIYPNPTSGFLHIAGVENLEGSVEIYSLLGQLVLKKKLSAILNLEDLKRGTYYLKVLDSGKQPVLTRKIIRK